jgi:5'-nucleotidase
MRTLRFLGIAVAALLALAGVAQAKPAGKDVDVQLLAINDFHGNLEIDPTNTIRVRSTDPSAAAVPAGGAARLAYDLRQARKGHPHSLTVSAGDLIGASPLTSALFHDEPTIEAMNAIGLKLNAVGNHEFDEGSAELLRMQNGGCHPDDGCFDGPDADTEPDGFAGADFGFLAANVVRENTGETLFPPYAIKSFAGLKVGFIGLTLEGTPEIVTAAGVAGLKFLDEAETINKYAAELQAQGVQAIVVLLHQGGFQSAQSPNFFTVNSCSGFSGDVLPIVNGSLPAVDMFITGHTHSAYNCVINGRPVTSASSFGRVFTDIEATLSSSTKDFTSISADNHIVFQKDAAGNPLPVAGDIATLVQHYKDLAAPIANQTIGYLSAAAPKGPSSAFPSGELPAGDLIADAQQASAKAAGTGSVAAFMNPGGVRGPDAGFPAGAITYNQAFTIQPFGNTLVTLTLTGDQILEMLKEQWCGNSSARVLQPSSEVHYTYDAALAASNLGNPPKSCASVTSPVSNVTISGVPVDPAASYRITVNNFLAGGGDTFPVLTQGTNRVGGALDLDALVEYLANTSADNPLPPVTYGRITAA